MADPEIPEVRAELLRKKTLPTNDLAEEFPDKADEIERLTRENPRFEALRRRNRDLWLRIQDLQGNAQDANSDERKQLEAERLGVLDEIASILRGGEDTPKNP